MEEFLKINWNPVDSTPEVFVTTEYLQEHSYWYKLLYDKNYKVFSSDSSDVDSDDNEEKKSDKGTGTQGINIKTKNGKEANGVVPDSGVPDDKTVQVEGNGSTSSQQRSASVEDQHDTADAERETAIDQPNGSSLQRRPLARKYVPGLGLRLRLPRRSALNTMEHSEFLRLLMMWKNKSPPVVLSISQQKDCDIYQMLNEVVAKEQIEFLSFVKSQWPRLAVRRNLIYGCIQRYVEEVWQHSLCRVFLYPRFYKPYGQPIPLVYPSEKPEVQLELLQNLLQMGELQRLVLPKMEGPVKVCRDHSRMSVIYPPGGSEQDSNTLYKVPVSKDRNAECLAGFNQADVVISSSGLQTIINNLMPFDKTWDIPVTIKEIIYQENGTEKRKKVVFVDKALPPKSMTANVRNTWYHKLGVRMLVCHPRNQGPGQDKMGNTSVPVRDVTSRVPAELRGLPKVRSKAEVADGLTSRNKMAHSDRLRQDDDDSGSDNLVIDCESVSEGETEEDETESLTDLALSPLVKAEKSLSDDPETAELANELSMQEDRMESSKDLQTKLEPTNAQSQINPDKHSASDSNIQQSLTVKLPDDKNFIKVLPAPRMFVTYRMWKLSPAKRTKEDLRANFLKGQGNCRDINLLVRCKLDASEEEDESKPVCVFPKLEYQYEFGAEALSLSEIVNQWTALQFRPNSKLIRVRVDSITSEVLMTETVHQQALVNEALQHQFRLRSSALGTLYNVLSHLVDLPVGHYLLCHSARSAGFASLLCHQPGGEGYDLHRDYTQVQTKKILEEISPWTPIDPKVVTPVHEALKHIPATFLPKPYKVKTKPKPKPKKKRKKK